MKIKLLSKDVPSNILDFVTRINKTNSLTALVEQNKTEDGHYIIQIETLEE